MKPIKTKQLLKAKVFSIIEKSYKTKEGNFIRTIVKHNNAVAIIPVIDKNKIILLKQFRHTIDDYMYEIPAGTLKHGENIRQCALRELEEETGYKTKNLWKLISIYLAPGYSTELLTIFIATNLYKGNFTPEKHENITPIIMPLNKAISMIKKGLINDSKSIVALLYYSFLHNKNTF